jgi:hypothetical protein
MSAPSPAFGVSILLIVVGLSFPFRSLNSDKSAAGNLAKENAAVKLSSRDFHTWKAIVLSNSSAEVLIVPAIGRVMQFNLLDEKGNAVAGPFWNNPAITDQLQSDSRGWRNYGGDKAWPAPQGDWPKVEGSAWPPPKAFDAMPYGAGIDGSTVELVSPIDPAYGIRVRRTISLDPRQPVMTIETTYSKVQGASAHIGVWTVTQLNSPERAFVLLPMHFARPPGYAKLLPPTPKDLSVNGRLLSLTRDPETRTMIGTEGEAILWVGDGPDLLIEKRNPKPAVAGAEWPERGSHSKIYTNSGNELKYVEFELLDPVRDLKPGESASLESSYTLTRRTQSDPLAEARKVFGSNRR